jgi:hypothetical protein
MLPDCDELFEKYFLPAYSQTDLANRIFSGTMPDLYTDATIINASVKQLCRFDEAYSAKSIKQIKKLSEAAQEDWSTYLTVKKPIDMSWIRAFDDWYTPEKILALIEESEPNDNNSDYVIAACELGAVIGKQMMSMNRSLEWLVDWPYWDSVLFHSPSGTKISVFHWGIKRLSDYGVTDKLEGKIIAALGSLGR